VVHESPRICPDWGKHSGMMQEVRKKARKELKELVERTRRKWTRIIVEDGYSVF